MRIFISCFVLGTIVPSYGQEDAEHTCEDATTIPACMELAMSGKDCVWNNALSSQSCVNRIYVDASVFGWSWDGRPEASSEGTKRTILRENEEVTHFNDFETHNWDRSAEYGSFQTYIRSDPDGRPTAMGLSIPTDLDGVFPSDEQRDPGGRFSLPKKHPCSKAIPFDHIMLNYAANGHPGGYEMVELLKAYQDGDDAVREVIATSSFYQRHFDVDFHLDTPEESNEIKCSLGVFPNCLSTPEEEAKFENLPSPEYTPASFVFDPISKQPFKGAHWQPADGVSDKDLKEKFAQNYGTYDGRVVLWESMVTATALEGLTLGVDKEFYFDVPGKVQVTGYYPQKLVMRETYQHGLTDAIDAQRVYQIELADLVFRLGDDAYKNGGEVKKHMSEDSMCPRMNCEDIESRRDEVDDATLEHCTSCGTIGIRARGKRLKGVKLLKVLTSCECSKFCKGLGADGFKFMQHPSKKSKKGKCTCLNDIFNGDDFDARHTSGVF